MYYYIFDIKKCKKRSQVEQIKDYLGKLGISGEFTYPTSAQTAEELTELGLKKKYSTIVAVGGDDIINSVANVMTGQEEAMGAIPLLASDALSGMLGVQNWREAAESLRFRKINQVHIGKTGNNKHFLTYVTLGINIPIEVTIEFKDFYLQSYAKNLVISNHHPEIKKLHDDHLDVALQGTPKLSVFDKLKTLVAPQSSGDKDISLLRARSLRIFTKTPSPILLDNKIVCKTPQLLETSDELLKIIVARKS